jgi:hypothetical protein
MNLDLPPYQTVDGPGEPAPKNAKTVQLASKVMASIFWNPKGILLNDYLQRGKTINGQNYKILLEKLKTAVQEKAQE